MPLTATGKKVMANMKGQYGEEKGERVYFASLNAGKLSHAKMEGKRKHIKKRKE